MRCKDCGLIQLRPRPVQKELGAFYEKKYFEEHDLQFAITDGEIERNIEAQRGWAVSVGLEAERGRLLDVGCASGFLVAAANRLGWQAVGLDISEWSTDFAREKLGIEAVTGTLDMLEDSEAFDAITMISSLEHQPDPGGTLGQAYRLLKPGGILAVHVPNVAGLHRRRWGDRWSGWDPPFHLFQFTPRTLSQMARKAGFQIMRIERQVFLPKTLKSTTAYQTDAGPRSAAQGTAPLPAGTGKIRARKKIKQWLGRFLSGRDMTMYARKPGSGSR